MSDKNQQSKARREYKHICHELRAWLYFRKRHSSIEPMLYQCLIDSRDYVPDIFSAAWRGTFGSGGYAHKG